MTQALIQRIHRVVAQVFGVPLESVRDESSPDTIPAWDSLTHINLILALEAEFGVSLTPEDTMEMISVRLIRLILLERGVLQGPQDA